jgi:hypothetical protein
MGLRRMPEMGGYQGRNLSMSQQPELTSTSLAPNPASAPGSGSGVVPVPAQEMQQMQTPTHATQRIPPWLVTSELFLRVLLRMYIGLLICYAPWSGRLMTFLPGSRFLWEQNELFVWFPTLGIYAAYGAVRGMVSGLGLLNLWIAFHEAIHYRER